MTDNFYPKHYPLFILMQAIRDFFRQEDFLDVMTPPLVKNPGMETHIHPFQVQGMGPLAKNSGFLHTSPEFHMKELLSLGYKKIFNICWAFRNEPLATHHRPQFLMLEWYRTECHYRTIMDDVEKLIQYCALALKENGLIVKKPFLKRFIKRMTVNELFKKLLDIEILDYLKKDDLLELINSKFKHQVPLPPESEWPKLSWEDLYFLLFLNKIEPQLKNFPGVLLTEYPAALSALSTIKKDDKRVCERFEVYLFGIEICNCYNELRDLEIQKMRFKEQAKLKKELYGYTLPEPEILYSALIKGFYPAAGIALGVERLLLSLLEESINPFWD